MIKCKICGREYNYNKRAGHTKTKCNSCLVNVRRFELKKRMILYKGGKCIICGYNKCESALDFHHIDPKGKDFIISGNHSKGWYVLVKELDKCVLICCRCHREVHDGVTKIT